MKDEKNSLKACIVLCIIDDKFHENEKRYLEDKSSGHPATERPFLI